jgi:hypothetical protein
MHPRWSKLDPEKDVIETPLDGGRMQPPGVAADFATAVIDVVYFIVHCRPGHRQGTKRIKCNGSVPHRGGKAGRPRRAINHSGNTPVIHRERTARSCFRFDASQLKVPGEAGRDGDEARTWAN